MLMTPPPGYSTTGYSPTSINRQNTQRLGMPGLQGTAVTGTKPTGAFSSVMPGVSSNPLVSTMPMGQQQMQQQALLKLLGR